MRRGNPVRFFPVTTISAVRCRCHRRRSSQGVCGGARYRNSASDRKRANHSRALDVTQAQSVAAAATIADDVTLLFNNTGVLDFGDILSVSEEQLRRKLDVNFFGALAVACAFALVIERNKSGAIVNTLTLLSLATMPGLSAYDASKAAAWPMHLSLRATLAHRALKVHGVFPGAVDTGMLAGVEMPKTSPQDVANAIVQGVEDGREDIFPDPMSTQVYAAWSQDHKAVERQFAEM